MSEPLREFSCVIDGNPGDAAVNGWKEPVIRGKGAKAHASARESDRYKAWKQRAALEYRRAATGRSFAPGPVTAAIVAYWPRQHRQGPAEGLPFGDVDAVAKAALDALEMAGVLGDDAQVVRLGLAKGYSKRPRIEVKVRAC